jgi:hypothetical protein
VDFAAVRLEKMIDRICQTGGAQESGAGLNFDSLSQIELTLDYSIDVSPRHCVTCCRIVVPIFGDILAIGAQLLVV